MNPKCSLLMYLIQLSGHELYWMRRLQNRLRRGGRLTVKDRLYYRKIEKYLKKGHSDCETMNHVLVLTLAAKEYRMHYKCPWEVDLEGNEAGNADLPYRYDEYNQVRRDHEQDQLTDSSGPYDDDNTSEFGE